MYYCVVILECQKIIIVILFLGLSIFQRRVLFKKKFNIVRTNAIFVDFSLSLTLTMSFSDLKKVLHSR